VIILALITMILITGCAPTISTDDATIDPASPQQQVPATQEVPSAKPTDPAKLSEPVIQVGSLDLYLPYISEQASDQVALQVTQFEEQNSSDYPGLNVNLIFLDSLTLRDRLIASAAAGELPAMAALDYNTVIEFGLYGYLQPTEEPLDFWNQFIDDSVSNNTRDGQILGFPWQRYSCSPNYLNLVIFKDQPPEVSKAAHDLSLFLINAENQKSNLENPDLRVYPTLKILYEDTAIQCPSVLKITINPVLISQVMESARLQSDIFANSFHIQTRAAQVAGLDASSLPDGSNTVLQAIAVPAATDQEFYKERQVIGYLTTINASLSPKTMSLESKALVKYGRLPVGSFLFACRPKSKDCLAVSANGEEFQIDPQSISWSNLPAPVLVSTAAFVQGSIIVQFYIGNVLYTITLF